MLRQLKPGEVLYREGDANDFAYVIAEGNIVLYRDDNGTKRIVERRGCGSVVGEVSILRGMPRAVTVEAETDCTVYQISAEQIVARFKTLDPLLRACIDTTIGFVEAFNAETSNATATCGDIRLSALIERLSLESDIGPALERGDIFMMYQPIVDLRDNRIAGFEALMRWTHQTLGPIPPDRFVAVAEEMGSIGDLTNFAISQTCEALGKIHGEFERDLFASINVTAADISRPEFVEFLDHTLDLHDLCPKDIKLELTESALVPRCSTAEINLQAIQKRGYGVSVDDFGTGYSNLGHLQILPLTALKIDRSFAAGAHSAKVNRGIVRMLIGLGKELKVDVIAEGVEDRADIETLKDLGCQFVQGYYFFKPMSADDLCQQLLKRSAKVA